jgi:CrcB protein
MKIVFVAIGSACGGVLRWGIGNLAGQLIDIRLPYGTLFINGEGRMFVGGFDTGLDNWAIPGNGRSGQSAALGRGRLCGGYTTFRPSSGRDTRSSGTI